MPSWRRIFTSYEAKIEEKAGACPPDYRLVEVTPTNTNVGPFLPPTWPEGMPKPPPFAGDDEDDEAPDE